MNLYKYIFLLAVVLVSASCQREELTETVIGDEVWVDFDFGYKSSGQVNVTTKATLDIIPESRVSNMFVYVFVGDKRYYAHYFDRKSLKTSTDIVKEADVNCWYVDQKTTSADYDTHGTVRIKAPAVTGGKLFIMANIDADMVNVSPEKLNTITSYTQLENLTAVLNQETTSRNGLFPMVGSADVDIASTGIKPSSGTGTVTVQLERFDAKVQVKVRVATDYELSETDTEGVTTKQTLKEFRPESWRVVNLPKGCYIVPRPAEDAGEGFFSTEAVGFETVGSETFTVGGRDVTSAVNGFSFYMLENRETAKNTVTSFHERERRNKNALGQFDESSGKWTNAPENGTYLEIKGEVVMVVDVSSEAKDQQLAADVTYYVHLGDIASSLNDYNINRNTIYTYTITIKGVSNIELEVTSSQSGTAVENEPGAEGMVYIAKESIFTFDAHYGQRVFCFDAANIDPETVTWYVKTPFGTEGTPPKVGDTEITTGMDYKWVHMLLNDKLASKDYEYEYSGTTSTATLDDYPYSQYNQPWPGDPDDGYESDREKEIWAEGRKVMDVVEFTKYIKEQKRAYEKGDPNDFRREFDQVWFDWYNSNHPGAEISDPNTLIDGKPGPWFRDRLYMTIFVDEFYYESDPVGNGDPDPTLWKKFVNQPNRLMHILCDNQESLDGASSATGSVITLRQRSIQTPYSLTGTAANGWGCETVDENADNYLWFYPGENSKDGPSDAVKGLALGNTSVYNGLYNTVRLWGCYSSGAWVDRNWSDFLDFNRPNDYNIVFLKTDKASLQYSAMMRNRDSNGNGVIDPEEVKWYLASLGQLQFLFFGELGLTEDAVLYPDRFASATGEFEDGHPYSGWPKWYCHIVSSSAQSGYIVPQVLWAEEGLSVSRYKQDTWESGPYIVKCVRNLGFTPEDFDTDDDAHRPANIVDEYPPAGTIDENSVYRFGMTNLNDKSKRFYTSVELEPYDENSEMARLYNGLETGPLVSAPSAGINSYPDLYNMLISGKSPCPDGYRVPNIREAAMMFLLCNKTAWWTGWIYNCSFYSMGNYGNKKNSSTRTDGNPMNSWNISYNGNVNLGFNTNTQIRCVRDWNPD